MLTRIKLNSLKICHKFFLFIIFLVLPCPCPGRNCFFVSELPSIVDNTSFGETSLFQWSGVIHKPSQLVGRETPVG